MMTGKELTNAIERLYQKSRAIGYKKVSNIDSNIWKLEEMISRLKISKILKKGRKKMKNNCGNCDFKECKDWGYYCDKYSIAIANYSDEELLNSSKCDYHSEDEPNMSAKVLVRFRQKETE